MRKAYLKTKLVTEDLDGAMDVQIAPQFMDAYLGIENQKARLIKQMNMYQKQLNDFDQKILQIKQKSAQEMKKQQNQSQKQPQNQQVQQTQQVQQNQPTVESLYNDNIDKLWEQSINEDSEINLFGDESVVDFSDDTADWDTDYDVEDEDNIDDLETDKDLDDLGKGGIDEDIFAVKLVDDEDVELIVKFYKDGGSDYWKARVVDGPGEPLESMRFEPDMDKLDIIKKLNDIPGYDDIKEIDIDDYKDLINDKEDIDKEVEDEKEKDEAEEFLD